MKYCWAPLIIAISSICSAAEPRVVGESYQLEQIAREPTIVTPVGMSCDARGRLFVVESHTHQRPEGYEGPTSDRIRVLEDSDGDGKLDKWSTFAEGFTHAMNVMVRPDGGVYVVTRSDVHLLKDQDNDGIADSKEIILRLETPEDYPHNALSGLALDGDQLYVGLGENMGDAYRLVGSDSTEFADSGGVGSIFVCRPDGSQLRRFATGFWNPFSLCLAMGRLFTVDNDPDASPPCRLIDVEEQGDYGFRFEYGRAGVHPLHSWNGQLPGTLPMVCGTGEAPTAVVFHRGYLWVTSWGDHRLERYKLVLNSEGALSAELEVVVQGEADFRPTGLTVGADGALYFGDWVDRSYPVHGKGRLWRLLLPEELRAEMPAAVEARKKSETELSRLQDLRWQRSVTAEERIKVLRKALLSQDPEVQILAVRWAAETRCVEVIDGIKRLLDVATFSERYYLAILGAIDWLEGEKGQRHSGITDGLLARELRNTRRSDKSKALALRLMSPDYKYLTIERLEEFLQSEEETLRLEAVRTLGSCSDERRFDLLVQLVQDEALAEEIRVEALVGLSAAWHQYRDTFEMLASGGGSALQREAERVLRLAGQILSPEERRPPTADLQSWQELLEQQGNPASGERLFFGQVGPQCSSCHKHRGRGGNVGPDLTNLSSQSSRGKTVQSIIDPSAEIAPHYQPTVLTTYDGKTHVGLRLPKGGDDGVEPYADSNGKRFQLRSETIENRKSSRVSIMPAGLEKSLTIQDLRDLVTFLADNGTDK